MKFLKSFTPTKVPKNKSIFPKKLLRSILMILSMAKGTTSVGMGQQGIREQGELMMISIVCKFVKKLIPIIIYIYALIECVEKFVRIEYFQADL